MRKVLISLAAAGTAVVMAAPASAQYFPARQGYGYGYGNVRALQARIDGIQRQIENLRVRRMISRNEAKDLRDESRDLERRLFRNGRNGLNYNEIRNVEYRIARLERHVNHEVRDGHRWDSNGNYGWNGNYGYSDRDRDGRNDRYEDDQGRDHDD